MQIDVHIGVKLRDLRRARGIGLRRLAARLGIDVSTISRIENGQRQPRREIIPSWAVELDLEPDELFYAFGMVPPDLQDDLASRARSVRDLLRGDA